MQRPAAETMTLADVLITEELSQRSSRSPNWQAENQAIRALARQLANAPASVLQNLVDTALNLCQAGTAGISVLETAPGGEERVCWARLAGTLAEYAGEITPRNAGFCGVCLDPVQLGEVDDDAGGGTAAHYAPQLFTHPERYFTDLQGMNTPIVEALVLPLIADGHALGTLWMMSHDEQRHFDGEDVRVMTSLADFAAAHLLNQRQTQQLLAANAKLETINSTDRKRVEEALRESEENYRKLFNSMDAGFCILQLICDEEQKPIDYRYIEINPVFERQTGMKNALGKTIRELVPDIEPFWFDIYGKVAFTGEPTHFEDHAVSMGRWFDVNAFRIGEPHERKVAVLFNDITVRKQAEAAMRAFFSNVSHEFRTPLTLLLGSIQETLSDSRTAPDGKCAHPLTPFQVEQMELAHRNAMRLMKLVNTLLNFSRIEAGHIRAVYEPTDLATLTIELASSFNSAIEQADLRLVIDCPPLPQPVLVDRSMWEKIVLNLLSNAFKFTFTGEIRASLRWEEGRQRGDRGELAAATSMPFAVLEVQDTGIGISSTELPRLWERFYQVKGAKGRTYEGSGIGLALVEELVKLHGGTIQVSSVEGEGSCFKVSIPTGFAHLPPKPTGSSPTGGLIEDGWQNPLLPSRTTEVMPYVEEALGWLSEEDREGGEDKKDGEDGEVNSFLSPSSSLSPLSRSCKPRILLVDDNADMRGYLKRILRERWQVETAANGAIALSLIQQQPPDLVLTDVMMPELDGLQLLRALRSDPQNQSIPVILLSARAGEEATVEGLEAGADDYLIKPFSARELVARVQTHLQLVRLRQERSADRFKNEFLLTITHELQAPLTAILGWSRLLQTQALNRATMARALSTIERNAMVEAKLVKDLLDVSSILSGNLRLKTQLVDLVALVQTVTTTMQAGAEAKSIQLVETISNIAHFSVLADGERLEQVITHLLSNAIKFTPEGGQVNICLERLDADVQITVSDTGVGIAPDFLPYVFDRFTQAEVPSRHSPGGLGIGLVLARYLVELHHGTIAVASQGEGRGATFTIKLPMLKATALHSNAPVQEA